MYVEDGGNIAWGDSLLRRRASLKEICDKNSFGEGPCFVRSRSKQEMLRARIGRNPPKGVPSETLIPKKRSPAVLFRESATPMFLHTHKNIWVHAPKHNKTTQWSIAKWKGIGF